MSTAEQEFYNRLKGVEGIKPSAPSEGGAVEKEMKQGDPDFTTPITLRNLFTHHDTHPVVLDIALLKALNVEWWGWEHETVEQEVQRLFKTQISEHARTKIKVVKTLHVSDAPWVSWQVFEKVIQGLNNNIPRWDVMQAPSLEQLYAGIDIMDSVSSQEFSDEVKQYAAAAVLHEDLFFVPPPLDFLQEFIAQPYYHCGDCGRDSSALFHDGVCDSCTNKFDPEHNLSFRPDSDLLAAGKGKNLELKLKFDPDPVEKRWREVSGVLTEKANLQETQEDIQVAKLLVARDYMNIRRRQLAEQLVSLKSWLGAV